MKPNPILALLPAPIRHPATLVVLATFVVLALGLVARSRRAGQAPTSFYEARRGTFTVSVTEGGTLAAVNEVSIRNEVEGTARVIYIVPEGTYVRKDDLLVELDSAQAQDQVNQQQINFEKARFALAQAEAQLEIMTSTTNSDFRAAKLKLDFAELDREKFMQGQQIVDLVDASNKLVQAQAQLAVNIDNYTWTTNLEAKGYETKQKKDVDRLAVLNSGNSVIVASNNVWILQRFDIPKQLATFESAVTEAKKELDRVVAQSKSKMAQYQADLLTQSNTLALNERKLERDRKNLRGTQIKAPQDGLVVYPVAEGRFSSESMIEEGATVRNRQELIKLPDVSRMKVTVRVHESHVNMVRVGQPAFVVLDSMPDQPFQATVAKVALLPDTQSRFGNPNLKVYNTDVVITDPLPGIKPGVSAKAEIIITNIADAISVPIQTVTTLGGKQVCYVLGGGQPKPVPVEVGLFNTKFIEITSGLKAGDRVLLSPPFDSHDKDLEGAVLTDAEKAKVVVTNASAATPDRRPATEARPQPNGARRERPDAAGLAERGEQAPTEATSGEANGENGQARAPGNRRRGQGGPDREAMMKQFDKDGDGQLSDSERQAMMEEFQKRFGGQRPGGGRGPRPGQDQNAGDKETSGGDSKPAPAPTTPE